MATALGENTNTAAIAEPRKDCLVNFGLVNVRCQLELGALVTWSRTLHVLVGEVPIFVDIVSTCELLQSDLALKRSLDTDLFRTDNLGNIDTGATGVLG